jgi:uncharacterized membrane protein YhdT
MSLRYQLTKRRSFGAAGTVIAVLIIGVWVVLAYVMPAIEGLPEGNMLKSIDVLIGLAIGVCIMWLVVRMIIKQWVVKDQTTE